jgi:hypothetical protein
MADNENTTPPGFVSTFPVFAECDSILRATREGIGLLTGGEEGRRRVDVKYLRCQLLTQSRTELGDRSLLQFPLWWDCRPTSGTFDPGDVLRRAYAKYTQKDPNSADIGFIAGILREIDDLQEGGGSSEDRANYEGNAGSYTIIQNLLLALSDFPRQGSDGRANLETIVDLSLRVTDSIKDIIVKAFPAAGGVGDNVVRILKIFLDGIFYMGDAVAEEKALRTEMASRLISDERVTNVGGGYEKFYGNRPSMITTRSWCAAGNAARDNYLAPGTNGAYLRAKTRYDDARRFLDTFAAMLERTQGESTPKTRERVFARFQLIGSWMLAYAADEVWLSDYITYDTIFDRLRLSAADAVVKVTFEPRLIEFKRLYPYSARAATRLECDYPDCDTDFWIPFWADTKAGNWNLKTGTADIGVTEKAIRDATNITFDFYATAIPKRSVTGRRYNSYKSKSVVDVSLTVMPLVNTLYEWARAAAPTWGKIKQYNLIRYALTGYATGAVKDFGEYAKNRIDVYDPAFRQRFIDTPLTWQQIALYIIAGRTDLGPQPRPEEFNVAATRCPGGSSDTSCLPCEKIKNRRPIGAREVQIPMLVGYTPPLATFVGSTNYRGSVEYAAWRKALVDAGYPGYYIDCIERDVTWVSSRAGEVISVRPPPPLVVSLPLAAVPKPRAVRTSDIPELTGITRPLVAEIAGPMLPRRTR